MKTQTNTKAIIALLLILVFPLLTFAQLGDPGGSGGGGDPDVPIDGGLSLLVAAGVGYGAKRLKQHKQVPKK
jgi:hypothetical protein